jgi:hypothetical protein
MIYLVMLVYIWWNISYSGCGNSSAHHEEWASVQDQESASYLMVSCLKIMRLIPEIFYWKISTAKNKRVE